MKTVRSDLALLLITGLWGLNALAGDSPVKYNSLDYEEKRVILQNNSIR